MTEPARSLLSRLRGAIGSLGHRTTTTAFRLGRGKADGDSHARRHRVAETSTPPSRDDIEWLANGTLATIPLALRRHLERVLIRVEEFPDEETCAQLGLRSPYIIAGHGRVLAARKLGLVEVPCIELAHLTPAQRRAYVIADNKLALNAGWDDELLKIELGELKLEG